jgi:hypothetical protein
MISGMVLQFVAQVPQGDYFHVQSVFDPQALFQAVPEIAKTFRSYFDLLAFVILASTVPGRIARHHSDLANACIPVAVYGLFVVIIPFSLNTIDEAVVDLVNQTGMTSPTAIFSRMMDLSDPFEPSDAGEMRNAQQLLADENNPEKLAQDQQQQAQAWGVDISGLVDFLKVARQKIDATGHNIKAALDMAKDPVGSAANAIRYAAFKIIAIVCAFLIWLLLQACGIVVYTFLTIRYLLVHLESIILPVFVAMMATETLRTAGVNFVLMIVGIVFWPLGWALGHAGTLSLANWFNAMIALTLHVPNAPQPGLIYDLIVNGPLQPAAQVPTPQAMAAAMLIALVGTLIIAIYVLMVTFAAPFVIGRALRTGSGMFADLLAGTARSTAFLAQSALQAAADVITKASAMSSGINGGTSTGTPSNNPNAPTGGGPMPIGANATNALTNLANRATRQAVPGTAGVYAANSNGQVAYIPTSPGHIQSVLNGNGNGGGSTGNGNGGGPAPASGGNGLPGIKLTGAAARAYLATMAATGLSAMAGVAEAGSTWDGTASGFARVIKGGVSKAAGKRSADTNTNNSA